MFHVIRRVGRFAPFPLAGLLLVLPLGSACAESLDHRVERLERIMQSQGLVEMQTRLDQLQAEVRTLRGDIELQGHNLEQLQQRQRDLYVDIDGRLRQLELGGAPAAGSQAPAGSLPPAAVPATAAPAPAQPAMDTAQEQTAYEEALNILREGRYPQAADAYRSFLSQYPDSSYAGNAQYWLAETYYVTRQFGTALEEFQAVVSQVSGQHQARRCAPEDGLHPLRAGRVAGGTQRTGDGDQGPSGQYRGAPGGRAPAAFEQGRSLSRAQMAYLRWVSGFCVTHQTLRSNTMHFR